jgi:NAD(P)H-hydrate epimerase
MADSAARWQTLAGVTVPAVTTAQIREIDRIAIEETGPDLLRMMENAGRSLVAQALEMLGAGWRDARIVVLAGPGGNGGGGICAARHLANRGAQVTLCLATPDRLTRAAAHQLKIYRATAGRLAEAGTPPLEREIPPVLIVDALIGYSLAGALRGTTSALIRWANGTGAPVLALDVPSGLGATTGEAPGDVQWAARTLTLALPKTGLEAPQTGELVLADIGIPAAVYRRLGLDYIAPFDADFTVPLHLVP